MTTSMRWFATNWKTEEVDENVVNRVLAAKNVLDIGCGHNPYKKFCTGNFLGIDAYIDTADKQIDFLNFRKFIEKHHNKVIKADFAFSKTSNNYLNKIINFTLKNLLKFKRLIF